MDLQRVKLHVFDLDDTLINTRLSYTKAQEAAILKTFPTIPPDQIRERLPNLQWLCRLFGSGNVSEYMKAFLDSEPRLFPFDPTILDGLLEHYHDQFQSNLTCFDDVERTLETLMAQNKTLALVSNGQFKSQLAKLEKTGLRRFFPSKLTYISENYSPQLKKPSPFMLEKACRETGISPQNSIYYGNTTTDMLAGNLAGMITACFVGSTDPAEDIPEIANPNFIFLRWSDLLSRLSRNQQDS